MTDLVAVVLPFVSVLIGAGLTYWFSIRQQRRNQIDAVYHEAIAAVAVAQTSHDFITQMGRWLGATDDEYQAFTSQLGREVTLNYARALASAMAALARASAYDPTLRKFLGEPEEVHRRADEIHEHLRHSLGTVDRPRRLVSVPRLPPSFRGI